MTGAEATHMRLTRVHGQAYADLFGDQPETAVLIGVHLVFTPKGQGFQGVRCGLSYISIEG